MSTAKEDFEAFARANNLPLERLVNDERYVSMETEWAWRGVLLGVTKSLTGPAQAAPAPAVARSCHKCGHPMSENPHPDAGKPGSYLEVGCPTECIPCTVLSRHQWAERAQKAESALSELRKQVAAPESTAPRLSIVLALARCGIAHEPPSDAFLHQLRRLTESLSPDDARHFKALLNWHDAGREKSSVRVVQSAPTASTDGAGPEHLSGEQVFHIAAPYFKWNAAGWQDATEGTITMTNLLAYTEAVMDAAAAPKSRRLFDEFLASAEQAGITRLNFPEQTALDDLDNRTKQNADTSLPR